MDRQTLRQTYLPRQFIVMAVSVFRPIAATERSYFGGFPARFAMRLCLTGMALDAVAAGERVVQAVGLLRHRSHEGTPARQRAYRTFSRSMMAWMRGSDRMGA